MINNILTSLRLLSRDPFYFRLWWQNKRIREDNPLSELSRIVQGRDIMLIVLHSNCLETMTGVDKETYELIRWMSRGTYRKMPIVTYYYSVARKQFGLQLFINGSLRAHWLFSDRSGGLDTFRDVCRTIPVRLCVVESLLGHPLSYMRILSEEKIRASLFIHDLYHLCPCPYLPIPEKLSTKGATCTQFKDLSIGTCEETMINLENDVTRGGMKRVVSEMPFLEQNKEYFTISDRGISIDIRRWRDTARTLLERSDCVVFSSELMRDTYCSVLGIPASDRFVVSYPNFLGRTLRF